MLVLVLLASVLVSVLVLVLVRVIRFRFRFRFRFRVSVGVRARARVRARVRVRIRVRVRVYACVYDHTGLTAWGSTGGRSGGLQIAAGALVLVASRLCSRTTVLPGPEGAVLVFLANCAAARRAVCQPQAVWMGRIGWKDVARSKLVRDRPRGVVDEAAARHGPGRRRRDLQHLTGR